MGVGEPPNIRDERRDPDLTRLKERIATVEKQADRTEKLANGMHYAMFGLPEDKTNNGLVGSMADLKESVEQVTSTLNRIFIVIIAGVGIDALARILLNQ